MERPLSQVWNLPTPHTHGLLVWVWSVLPSGGRGSSLGRGTVAWVGALMGTVAWVGALMGTGVLALQWLAVDISALRQLSAISVIPATVTKPSWYHTVPYHMLWYRTLPYHTTPYCTILYHTWQSLILPTGAPVTNIRVCRVIPTGDAQAI